VIPRKNLAWDHYNVLEVFDSKEVVSCCTKKYIPCQRIIPLRYHSPISLSPQLFRKMLKLSNPTLTFRGQDCKQFLEKHHNGLDILEKFLEDLTTIPEDITRLQVVPLEIHYGKFLR
jgi:hypothetical protein